MDYKKEIIKTLEQIEDIDLLIKIYSFITGMLRFSLKK